MPDDFYLASRSPRRVQLLREAGYRFECRPSDVVERVAAGEAARDYARRLALAKAEAVRTAAASGPDLPVLGADTDVSIDGHILGKPRDREEALDMLMRLSDRAHQVHTAIAVCHGQHRVIDSTCTEVVFGHISREEAQTYWDSGEPADKAGAYAIQGIAGRWVREIRGSYGGVVGLPVYETMQLLRRFGIQPGMPR